VPTWSGKTRGGISGYKLFVFFIKHFGLSFAYFILRFVIIYFLLFSPKSVRIIFNYFHRILKFGFLKSCVRVCENYFLFGQVLIDKLTMLSRCKTKLTFEFEGEEYLRKMADNNTGGLLISAHIGNFEIAGHLLKRLYSRINIVMLEAEHKQIKEYLSGIFKENNVNIISIKNDFSHIYEINNAFKNREIVCMHGDRFVEGSKTVTTSFLGQESIFPCGPFYLAQKYNIPVSYVFAMKDNKYHYHFYASPLKSYYQQHLNLQKRNQTVLAIIKDYIYEFERIIHKYPEQWFNYYEFWVKEKQ
jgi:predicted LPLAT superfamily acyltransferase